MTRIVPSTRGAREVAIAVALMTLGGCISLALGQDANWDLKNYHIYIPYAFMHGRLGLDVAPAQMAQMQTYLNPLLDIPYFLLAVQLQWPSRVVAFL